MTKIETLKTELAILENTDLSCDHAGGALWARINELRKLIAALEAA